jgi:hypothetical protein
MALWYDPALVRRRVIWKVAFKLVAILVVPHKVLRQLMRRYPKPFDTESLLYRITFGD